MMKAVSLWQPWASAMEHGLKRNETRSWPIAYRGDLIVCSAKRRINEIGLDTVEAMMGTELVRPEDRSIKESLDRLPYGTALCVVEVCGCVESEKFASYRSSELSKRERLFGDYSIGRFVWMTRNCRRLNSPVPVVGRQGLFEIIGETLNKIKSTTS